jgi:hypothetical protein
VPFHLSVVLRIHWGVLYQLESVCAVSFERCIANILGCLVSAWVRMCHFVWVLYCQHSGMTCVHLYLYVPTCLIVNIFCTFPQFSSNPTLTSCHYLLPFIALLTLQCFFLCVICSYILRMKEYERERRLLQRKKRIEARAQHEETLVAWGREIFYLV